MVDYHRKSFTSSHVTTRDRIAWICITKISFVSISLQVLLHLWRWSRKFWAICRPSHEYIHKPGTRVQDKDFNWWFRKHFPFLKIVLLARRCATLRCHQNLIDRFDFRTFSVIVKEMCTCVHVHISCRTALQFYVKRKLIQHCDDKSSHLE